MYLSIIANNIKNIFHIKYHMLDLQFKIEKVV